MPAVIANAAEFDKAIAENKKVIVDFHAVWCGPCKLIAPKYEAFSKEFADIVFLKIDVDQVPDVSEKAGIRAMPTFQTYLNGQKLGELLGADPTKLKKLIEELASA